MRTKKKVDLQAVCDEWNRVHKVGAAVVVTKDFGEQLSTNTRSGAWVLPSGDAVIMVIGITGCYLLERVKPRAP